MCFPPAADGQKRTAAVTKATLLVLLVASQGAGQLRPFPGADILAWSVGGKLDRLLEPAGMTQFCSSVFLSGGQQLDLLLAPRCHLFLLSLAIEHGKLISFS